jgi:DNA polymerase I-like protein with 3'-5' exonuclease and polymerase domains
VEKPLVVTDAAAFLAWLQENTEGPYGLDCETVGVDPTEESPVGKGKIVCWSIGWVDPALGLHPERGTPVARSAFLWADSLDVFADWLRSAPVVGHNVVGFDRHMFRNHGIDLGGIVGDSLRMAKLLDVDSHDNSLKSWIRRAFDYGVGEYTELFSRRKPGATEDLGAPRDTWRKVDDQARVPTVVGGPASRVGAARDLIPLDRIREDYPQLLPVLYEYAGLDAKGSLELFFLLQRRLREAPWRGLGQARLWGTLWDLYRDFWHPSLGVLHGIERRGIQYDAGIAAAGRTAAEQERQVAHAAAIEWVGHEVNLDSPAQLAQVLYQERFYDVPPVMGTVKAIKANRERKPSTSEAALQHIAIQHLEPGIEHILKERKLTDLIQFLDRLPTFQDTFGRIHSILKPDTRTGRLSSSKPNLQNIPKDDTYGLRSAFVAAPGHSLVVADYGALEPRLQAHFLVTLFNDTSLLDAINFGDVYSGIALECWPDKFRGWTLDAIKADKLRGEAKIVLLAKAYGKGLMGMALQLKKSVDETRAIVERIDSAFPGVPRFQVFMADYAREHGGVHTLLGRFRPLPNIYSKDRGLRAGAERQAYNTPIQGSATDVMTAARGKLDKLVSIVLEVHDEMVVECRQGLEQVTLDIVTKTMCNPLRPGLLKVPLIVEAGYGPSWAKAKK